MAADAGFSDHAAGAFVESERFGAEVGEGLGADIVAGVGIVRAGIAEAYD